MEIALICLAAFIAIVFAVGWFICIKCIIRQREGIDRLSSLLDKLRSDYNLKHREQMMSIDSIALKCLATKDSVTCIKSSMEKFFEQESALIGTEAAASKAAIDAEKAFSEGLENILNYGGNVPKLNKEAIKRE